MYIGIFQDGANKPTSNPLPGRPDISMDDKAGLINFVRSDMIPSELNRIAPRLWWLSKKDGASISPLHRQQVKGRTIVITEEPRLHLVWAYDRIFIKPLPEYLISRQFWNSLPSANLGTDDSIGEMHLAMIGFLRSYAYLIQHASDFNVARSLNMIPENVTWEDFSIMRPSLLAIPDSDCAPRYSYGEIRLNRLNVYAPLLLRRRYYQRLQYHYGDYFHKFYAPVLFVMALVSLVLSALQVISQVQATALERAIDATLDFCRGLGYFVMVVTCLVGLLLLGVLIFKFVKEWVYALSQDRGWRGVESSGGKTAGEKV